jgi:uncharacterized phage protein (TIGR02220 family)
MANSGQIIKVSCSKGFTVIPNAVAQSKELTLGEKGLLLYLNSLPETFVIYKSNLHELLGEREGTVDTIFKSLREKGYIQSEKKQNEKGEFAGWQHRFSLDPSDLLPKPTLTDIGQNTPIYSKEDNTNILIKDTYPILVKTYNELFGKSAKGDAKSKRQFSARIKEGYTLEDFKNALEGTKASSYHRENGYQHITLEFITRSDKLEKFREFKPQRKETGEVMNNTEQRYWDLIKRIELQPRDNSRYTLEERRFIIEYQQYHDRFPPDERKLVQDTCSLTRAEIDQKDREEGWIS